MTDSVNCWAGVSFTEPVFTCDKFPLNFEGVSLLQVLQEKVRHNHNGDFLCSLSLYDYIISFEDVCFVHG